MDEYIKKYDTLEKKLVFIFGLGQGGIGDCTKFFMQALCYAIEYDIKLYYFKSNIVLEKYLKLKHEKMYLNDLRLDDLIKTDYSMFSKLEPNVYYHIHAYDLYFQPINVSNNYDYLKNVKDVFYMSDEVIINKNILIPPNINTYTSVHLRLGDKHLETDKNFVFCLNDERYFNEEKMFRYIEDNIETNNIIFFCDNNNYKLKMKEKYEKLIMTNINIGHTSLFNTSEQETLDAITEFYIMANSDKIYSASHSGFSIVASKFNNIPLCS